jgi:hypothetical protein
MISNPINSRNTLIANPASTSALSSPNGCLIELLFHTSKLLRTSTATHRLAPRASKTMRWLSAVRARLPCALYSVNAATNRWQKHHKLRVRCSVDIERYSSLQVGIGRLAGSDNGARTGGSRKIWWDTDECLYLWPRRWL